MRITWRRDEERRNVQKHGLDFSLAAAVFADPLAVTLFDRLKDGEERWHTVGAVATGSLFKVLLVVHIYPGHGDEEHIHIIGLREATSHERRRYEEAAD